MTIDAAEFLRARGVKIPEVKIEEKEPSKEWLKLKPERREWLEKGRNKTGGGIIKDRPKVRAKNNIDLLATLFDVRRHTISCYLAKLGVGAGDNIGLSRVLKIERN